MSGSTFEVVASDFGKAADQLTGAGYRREAGRLVAALMRKAANIGRREIRAAMRPHRRSGKMAGAVRTYIDGYGLDTTARVRAGGPTAHLIVGGTRAHEVGRSGVLMPIHGPGRSGPIIGGGRGPWTVAGIAADPVVEAGIQAADPYLDELYRTAADGILAAVADMAGKRGG